MKNHELIAKLSSYHKDLDIVFANREDDQLYACNVDCVVLKESESAPFTYKIVLHTEDETENIDDDMLQM